MGNGMQDPPGQSEVLEAVAEFLEGEIAPAHDGVQAYHLRIAVNLCRMLARESRLEAQLLDGDLRMLADFLRAPEAKVAPAEVAAEVRRLGAELSSHIRSGAIDGLSPETLRLVKELIRNKLLVARPDYLKGGERR